jgi:hypothetical protein
MLKPDKHVLKDLVTLANRKSRQAARLKAFFSTSEGKEYRIKDGGSDVALFGGWSVAAVAGSIGTVWIVSGHLLFFSENVSAAAGIDASATCYSRAENIGVFTIVVPELKLSDVQRQILFADLVERPHDATLHQRPEAINCLSVDRADDVLTGRVANDLVRRLGVGDAVV